MRILLLVLALFSLSLTSAYAETTTTQNGVKITINTPKDISDVVKTVVENRIEKFLAGPRAEGVFTNPATGTGVSEDPKNWEYDIEVKKIYSNEYITSLLMNTYQYTGGAHGMSSRVGLVIDNTTGKLLTLKDFYNTQKLVRKLSSVWQLQIRAKLAAALGQKLSPTDKEWIRQGTLAREQYESFVLTKTSLIVYGQDYQHAPRAYGTFTLIYPRKFLEDIELQK